MKSQIKTEFQKNHPSILKDMLDERQVTQSEFARRAGMTQANVSKLCKLNNLSFDKLCHYAELLNYSYSQLRNLVMKHIERSQTASNLSSIEVESETVKADKPKRAVQKPKRKTTGKKKRTRTRKTKSKSSQTKKNK